MMRMQTDTLPRSVVVEFRPKRPKRLHVGQQKYFPELHDDVVRRMNAEEKTDVAIAAEIGVSAQLIYEQRKRMGILSVKRKGTTACKGSTADLVAPAAQEKPVVTLMEKVKSVIGSYGEKNGGLWWNGYPYSFMGLVREANRVLLSRGEQQIGPKEWWV